MRELRQNASRYLRRVAAGESITVTDRGRPVAVLVPPPRSSLDEVHLVSALQLGSSISALVGYDRRLLDAAAALGPPVASPGAA